MQNKSHFLNKAPLDRNLFTLWRRNKIMAKTKKKKDYDVLEDAQKKSGAASGIFADIKAIFGKLASVIKGLGKL